MDNEQELIQGITDHLSADVHVNSKDFDECILKIGSFLSIVNCKKLSAIQLFIVIAQSDILQEIIIEMLGVDTFEQFVREYAIRYPIICKSKIIINKLSQNKNAKRKSKSNL